MCSEWQVVREWGLIFVPFFNYPLNYQQQHFESDKLGSVNKDVGYQQLMRKINQTSRELTATKNGKSILRKTLLDTQKTDRKQTGSIPLLAKEDLRRDFMKLIELKGPQSQVAQSMDQTLLNKQSLCNKIPSRCGTSIFQKSSDALKNEVAQAVKVQVSESIKQLEPPIGLIKRMTPQKQLRLRFYFPEFQNRIDRLKTSASPMRDAKASANPILIQENKEDFKSQTVVQRTLPDFVKYCKHQNIPFSDSERLFFDLNQNKKNHKLYQKCLQYCYQANQVSNDEAELAVKQLERADELHKRVAAQFEETTGFEGKEKLSAQQIIEAANRLQDLQTASLELTGKKETLKHMKNCESDYKKIFEQLNQKLENPNSRAKINFARSTEAKSPNTRTATNFLVKSSQKKQHTQKMEKISQSIESGQDITSRNSGIIRRFRLKQLFKTQSRISNSKNRLQNELLRVMEKVDLDRPQTIRDKAEYVLKLNNSIDSSLSKSVDKFSTRLQSRENPNNELKALQTIRKQTKQRLEIQKQAYLNMLDYVRLKQGRQYRVSEDERKIFDALKIITEACWIIQGEEQLVNLLHEIGVSLNPYMPQQLKDFLDVLFGLMGFSKLYLSEIN